MPCSCCEITDSAFSESEAKVEIKKYRKYGPARQTKLIIDAIRSLKLKDFALLDIGGGIGSIYHELLGDVASKVTHVDASSAYLTEARKETSRRGNTERVNYIHADFTEVEADLPQVDVVTLDRVVCCYPNFRRLLEAAAGHSRKAIAMTYPRETWYMRLGLHVINFFQRLKKDPFRVYLHPVHEMDRLLIAEGLKRVKVRRLIVWEMAMYQREE